MTAFNQTELLVLAHLSPKLYGIDEAQTKEMIAERIAENISSEHLDVILRYLTQAGLAEQKSFGNEVRYQASLAGNAAVGATGSMIAREHSARLRSRARKLAEQFSQKPREYRSKVDWGKWGSIAGIIAIPITILLWWFS